MAERPAAAAPETARSAQDVLLATKLHTPRPQPGVVPRPGWPKVAPTLRYEGLLLAEAAGTVSTFADLAANVLLMGGDLKRPAFLGPAFDAFARTLPNNRQARFAGLDHGASGDPGPANRGAQPAVLTRPSAPSSASRDPVAGWPGSSRARRGPPGGARRGPAGGQQHLAPRPAPRLAWLARPGQEGRRVSCVQARRLA